jgi:hypothetical protein
MVRGRSQAEENRWCATLVLAGASAVALLSASDYAGGANDGSRLATVECLVDYHTLAIDHSIFVQVPARDEQNPYTPSVCFRAGTPDKVYVRGHYYSDKPAVPALLTACLYQVVQWSSGLTAREQPHQFCYWMTVGSSGMAYVLAVWCVYRLGRPLRLEPARRLALTASFALGTLALSYGRQVNSHIVLLAVAAGVFLAVAWLAENRDGRPSPWRMLALGSLAGLGYAVEVGAGLGLLLGTAALIVYRCRDFRSVGLFALATLPWVGIHHAVNYAIGGTWAPLGTVPEYFQWPGSPFNAQNLTGVGTKHRPADFLVYALELLVGRKRGFLGHNLPLFLALGAAVALLWRRGREWPEVLLAAGWCAGTWLMYAVGSTNYAGRCCSIRWFVPLLAAGYYVLALWLERRPDFLGDFLVLSGWGAVAGCLAWWEGPYLRHEVALFWLLEPLALASWLWYRMAPRRLRRNRMTSPATFQGGLACARPRC